MVVALMAFVAPCLGLVGITAKAAVNHHIDLRQQGRQGTCSSAFCSAALTPNEHTPDLRADGIQDQSPLHAFLADYRCKWENNVLHQTHSVFGY
jgi:hypothetical protein